MTKKITLSEIAKKAGLSIASVSRVVHQPHLTTLKTKERVYAAMNELEYNALTHLKKAPRAVNSKKILVIDNQHSSHDLIHQGIEHGSSEWGYELFSLRFYSSDKTALQKIVQYTLAHDVAGIVFINDAPYLEEMDKYIDFLPPILFLNQFKVRMPCAYFDHTSASFEATQHLIQNGHRQILLLLSESQNKTNDHLLMGFKQALKRNGLQFEDQYVLYYANHYERLKQQLCDVSYSKQTAMICADCSDLNRLQNITLSEDHSAEVIDNVLAILDEKKAHFMAQCALVFMTHKKKHISNPKLNRITSIYKPFIKMGYLGVQQLLKKIENPNYKMQSVLVDQEWCYRG